ncbi:MAG: DUF4149 domain-containing protein [Myxococcota bacterium]
MHSLGLLAAGLSIGSVVWVFLVQAPWLTRKLGRDAFVPLMMKLVPPLLVLTGAASVVMLATSPGEHHLVLAGGSLGLTLLAAAVMPRALRAGAQSLRERLEVSAEHSSARFLADGGGAASRLWHRVLGLSVVALLATQLAWFLVPATHAAGHAHGESVTAVAGRRFPAPRETVEDVAALTAAVEQALASAPASGAETARSLRARYDTIFQRCTMTGDAHEALHAFLVPVGETLGELERAQDAVATRAHLERLRAQLAAWPERFEG